MKQHAIKTEFRWLAGILLAVSLMLISVIGTDTLAREQIDVPLHDVYFIFEPVPIFITLVLFFSFSFWLVRLVLKKKRLVFSWYILLIMNGLSIFAFWVSFRNSFSVESWTYYPPLSRTPQLGPNNFPFGIVLTVLLISFMRICFLVWRKRR